MQRTAEEDQRRWVGVESAWSWARVITFAALCTLWYPVRDSDLSVVGVAGCSLAAFMYCLRRHAAVRRQRESAERLLMVLRESRERLGGAIRCVRGNDSPRPLSVPAPLLDDGPTWTLTGQEIDDLDYHAPPVGLYGLLNRTSSCFGAARLARMLGRTLLNPSRLRARQESVRWLDEHPEVRFVMLEGAAALRGRDDLLARLHAAIEGVAPLDHPSSVTIARIWSGVTLGLTCWMCYVAAFGRYGAAYALLLLLMMNAGIFRTFAAKLKAALSPWRELTDTMESYWTAAGAAARRLPDDGELGALRDAMRAVADDAVLPRLVRRLGWVDVGGLLHTLLNQLLFYDLHVAQGVLSIAVRRRDDLLRGLSALGDVEALTSLACFGWEQPDTCYPMISDGGGWSIEDGRHPLIEPRRAVANSLSLDAQSRIAIVTGSNMAGKSTFLRMAGVNAVLGLVGAAVCARRMTLSPVRLTTDLRVRDNLADDESYFLAEVRHIRRMVSPPVDDAPLLGLIDEPFRGTNSDEQAAATLALVEYLKQTPYWFIVATHERRVTELADDLVARNFHFAENLDERGMVFDYQLRSGPARRRNALRLMAREGFPAELLRLADQFVMNPMADGALKQAPENDRHG